MTKQMVHLAGRIFGSPLLIQQQKLDVILQVLGPRLGVEMAPAPKADMESGDPYSPSDQDVPDNIALIQVIGPMVKRASGDFVSGGPTTYAEIADAFEEAYTSPSISGILIELDSPGGEVGGLFDLAEMIYQSRGTKPVYAIANDDAFSAAYALASACDRIYITQTGGVGSVGVIAAHCDQSQFDANMGVKYTYVFAGDRKADMNPHEPISDAALATLQAEIDRLYGLFVGMVARNRRMNPAAVRATQAGLYFGANGVGVGFADAVGTFDDALADLVAAATGSQRISVGMAAAVPNTKEVRMDKLENPVPAAQAPEQPAEDQQQQPVEQAPEAKAAPMKKCDACGHDYHADQKCGVDGCDCMGTAAKAEPAAAEPTAPAPGDERISLKSRSQVISDMGIPSVLSDLGAVTESAAVEIVELCAVAGLTAKDAKAFMERKLSPAAVRRELIEQRAAATDKDAIVSHVRPESTGGSDLVAARAMAAELATRKGISREAAMVELCRENPKIYQQYLASSQHPKAK